MKKVALSTDNKNKVNEMLAILHFVLPAVLALIFDRVLRKMGKIKDGDYKLNI